MAVLATTLLAATLAGGGCAGSSSGPEQDAEVAGSRLVQLRIEGMT